MNSIKVFVWFMYPVMEMMWRWNTRSVVNYLKIILAIKIMRGKQIQKKKNWEENPIYKSAEWILGDATTESWKASWFLSPHGVFSLQDHGSAQKADSRIHHSALFLVWRRLAHMLPPAWPLSCLGLRLHSPSLLLEAAEALVLSLWWCTPAKWAVTE